MMTVEITNQIKMRSSDLPEPLIKKIKDSLTLQNPKFLQAIKYNYRTQGIPQAFKLYNDDYDYITLPRGYGRTLFELLKEHKIRFEITDQRRLLDRVDFGSKIQLRPYQEAAVIEMAGRTQGGVVAPCGAGKTMIGLEVIARIGQPALWITHTRELAAQAIERACQMFDMTRDEIGRIGEGEFSVGDRLTVALIQTLSKADFSELKDRFGTIVVDEAHHLAAHSFFYPVGQFPAKYRLWLSATPERSDGLTEMVFAAGGPILHTIEQSEVPTIIPQLTVIETEYNSFKDDYVRILTDLILNDNRNELIVETIAANCEGNYSLVLSDRTEHLDILMDLLKRRLPDLNIEMLTGSMRKKERTDVMERVKAKEVDILLATQLAREGLDITHLNRLFLATPKRAAAAVQQEVGRVMRPASGKSEAIVFDFWDSRNGILKSQFWKRREVYRKIGMDWQPAFVKRA